MLVLSRKLGEVIHIGNDITIQVVYLSNHKVRLGIVAPRDVNIARAELLAPRQGDQNAPVPPEISEGE